MRPFSCSVLRTRCAGLLFVLDIGSEAREMLRRPTYSYKPQMLSCGAELDGRSWQAALRAASQWGNLGDKLQLRQLAGRHRLKAVQRRLGPSPEKREQTVS